MDITYDQDADALNIIFQKGKVAKTKEVSKGVLLDIDRKNIPLYLEILQASKRFKKSQKILKHKTSRLAFKSANIFNHARRKTKTIA